MKKQPEYMDHAWVELRAWIDDIIDVEDDLYEAQKAERYSLASTCNFKIPKTSNLYRYTHIFIYLLSYTFHTTTPCLHHPLYMLLLFLFVITKK